MVMSGSVESDPMARKVNGSPSEIQQRAMMAKEVLLGMVLMMRDQT